MRPQQAPRITPAPDPYLSRSLEYGLTMLECLSTERPALGIADLAEKIRISRSTAHRYACTLVTLGYLEQDDRRKYRLAGRVLEPGMAAIGAIRLRAHARPVLERLREHAGHTVSMGVLDGTRAIYIDRLLGHRPGQYEIDRELGIGVSLPLHCTALGKALMAGLPEIKRRALISELRLAKHGPNSITGKRSLARELQAIHDRGVALSDEELARGMRAVAACVDGFAGRALAIEVMAPAGAYTAAALLEVLGPLAKEAARQISQALRGG